jgi:anti-sigma-K factor RskA
MERNISFEYVLGALSEDERQNFEKRISTDARLYQDAVQWNNHLLTLVDATPSRKNPIEFREIEKELFTAKKNKKHLLVIFFIAILIIGKVSFGISALF